MCAEGVDPPDKSSPESEAYLSCYTYTSEGVCACMCVRACVCVLSAGLRFWRPWRTEKNEAPLQILKF